MTPALSPRPTEPDDRRDRILAAARQVFASQGGLSVGLRPIAAAAGCTTGAIYAVFSGKEAIYAALLARSLDDLTLEIAAAAGREAAADAALRAASTAFFEYYQKNGFEYGLGLYLFERDGRKGLDPEHDAALNAKLARALGVLAACFQRLGAPAPDRLAHALFASLMGVVAMAASQRDRSLKTDARAVLDAILDTHLAALTNNTVIDRDADRAADRSPPAQTGATNREDKDNGR